MVTIYKEFTTAHQLNTLHKSIVKELGTKAGKKYIEQAEKLINPNCNTIVEYRPNGIVTREGEDYIFNALADIEFETWRIAFKRNINEQFI